MTNKRDIQTEITDKIIELIELHGSNWTKPFSELCSGPSNALTGKRYNGVNALFLGLLGVQHAAGYGQWKSLGAQVRKGEKGIAITAPIPIQDKTTGEVQFMKWSHATVFSSAQVDGWEAPVLTGQVDQTEVLGGVDDFVSATGADIRFSAGGGCYFSPAQNFIHMLHREQFTGTATATATECFYSTMLHELVHWSGHKSRLDRLDLKNKHGYGVEELIAEIGSAILCTNLGVSTQPQPDHAQYISGWLQALKGDKSYIFKAAAQAQKAVDFLDSLQAAQEVAA